MKDVPVQIEDAMKIVRARPIDVTFDRRDRVWASLEQRRHRAPSWRAWRPVVFAAAAAALALASLKRPPPRPPLPPAIAVVRGDVRVVERLVVARSDAVLDVRGRRAAIDEGTKMQAADDRWHLELGHLVVESDVSARPFLRVTTDDLEAVVHGGRVQFDVVENRTTVAVLAGRVTITRYDDPVGARVLEAGESLGRDESQTRTATIALETEVPAAPPPVEPRPLPRRPAPEVPKAPVVRTPDDCATWMARADELRRAGRWSDAAAQYARVSASPDAGALLEEALLRRARLLVADDRHVEARAVLDEAERRVASPLLLPERQALETKLTGLGAPRER